MVFENFIYPHRVMQTSNSCDSSWTDIPNSSRNIVKYKGTTYQIIATKERHFSLTSSKRILGIIAGTTLTIFTLGFSLFSKSLRELFTGR